MISKTNTVTLRIEDAVDGNMQLIDPNGYKDELQKMVDERIMEINPAKVDQTYSPDSENAQSGKAVAETINKDWLESDETSFAYIKNRTHYETIEELPLVAVEGEEYEGQTNFPELTAEQEQLLISMLENSSTTVVNTVYGHILYNDITVEYNGQAYVVGGLYNVNGSYLYDVMVCSDVDDIIRPAPLMQVGTQLFDNTFTIGLTMWDFAAAGETVTFKGITEIKKLDEKFMPDSVATKSYVQSSLSDMSEEIGGEMDTLRGEMGGLSGEVSSFDSRISANESEFGNVWSALGPLENDVTNIKAELDGLEELLGGI